MAIIGVSIGLSFALALVLGPVLNTWIGVPGIFWLTAVLALAGIGVVLLVVPNPSESLRHRDAESIPGLFGQVLRDPNLVRLDFGILCLHMLLTALFLVVPLMLRDLGLASVDHWQLYLPVMFGSLLLMVPFIILAERYRRMKAVFLGAVGCLTLAQFGLLALHGSLAAVVVWVLLFFASFNLLEAMLPSLISKQAPADSKGTAMGVYSSSQFFGAFLGGLLGGSMHQWFGSDGVLLFAVLAGGVWFLVALGMANPPALRLRLLKVGPLSPSEAGQLGLRLREIPGVAEAVVIAEEGMAYLKVDTRVLDQSALDEFSAAGA
jgi:predicted MFS family arabinose efflux permease